MHDSNEYSTQYLHYRPPSLPLSDRLSPDFSLLTAELSHYVREVLHLEVSFERFSTKAKAIFDGSRIELNDRISAEDQAFILLHLSGHAAQLATLPEWVDPPADRFDLRRYPENEAMVRSYERQASCYGAGLLITLERASLLPWFNRIAARDLEDFIGFCKGEHVIYSKNDVIPEVGVSLFPLEMPKFTPIRVSKIVIV